jgi:hypothetical protein
MGQGSTEYQCWQDQCVRVCANKTCLAGCEQLDQCDNWYLQTHFWALDTFLNLADVDWAMHAFDWLAKAQVPKENPNHYSPLSM